ncbi:MAG: SOS response-associated peptidase [Rhodocyclaceae bacterium]
MCGRIDRHTSAEDIARRFGADLGRDAADAGPGWNLAPGRKILALVAGRPRPQLAGLVWGFVPRWARDAEGVRPINARADTVFARPMFREAIRHRRCLIPVDGFYEWKREGGRKLPYYFRIAGEGTFTLGGIWESWSERGAAGEGCTLHTCAILTTAANEAMAPVHDRMPLIVAPDDRAPWLSGELRGERGIARLLLPCEAAAMECWRVGPRVNNASSEGEDLIRPVPE